MSGSTPNSCFTRRFSRTRSARCFRVRQTLGEAVESIAKQDGVFFSDRFLLPRPLLQALLADKPSVLLIDEVDKSDAEFEAFLSGNA